MRKSVEVRKVCGGEEGCVEVRKGVEMRKGVEVRKGVWR